jgi:transcriptional regulator with XRE-family HTH domain
MEEFYKILRRERLKRSLSQPEIAGEIGTTYVNISRWEHGNHLPTPYFRRKLCEFFNMSTEELFPGSTGPAHTDTPTAEAPAALAEEHSVPVAEMPFAYKMKLVNIEDFFGRRYEINLLLARTTTGQSTAIVGPRRIGKSWLLRYLYIWVQQHVAHLRMVYIDASLPRCSTLTEMLGFILEALHLAEPAEKRVHNYLKTLETAVQDASLQKQNLVLCIDKFDRMCQMPEMHADILDRFRAMTEMGLGLVVACRESLITVTENVPGLSDKTSPLINVFQQLRLKPFTRLEAQQFIQAKGEQAGLSEQERTYVLKYAGGSETQTWMPQHLQLVGTLLFTDKVTAQEEGYADLYRPLDPAYWAEFEQRVEAEIRGTG